jgi:TonB-linked SusC/RagA family outer membrane protein
MFLFTPLRRGGLLLLLLLNCWQMTRANTYTPAQNDITVSGTVRATETNEPLEGVTIQIKGTARGTVTDAQGKYELQVPDGATTLIFSYTGYERLEIEINGRTTIDITLGEDDLALDEVVVVGYGSLRKSQSTGAISSISEEEIGRLPVTNAQQALQGRAAGVDVVATGSRPGSDVSVRIRGRRSFSAGNEPLYVLDGIPLSGGLGDINQQDIQSMEILKDASATAIYGSRGANGVVLITTKRGRTGRTTVAYDAYYGLSEPVNKVDLFDGAEFAEYKRESRRATGSYNDADPAGSDARIFDPVELDGIKNGRTTDYQDLLLRDGYQQSHQLGVTGGNEKTQFGISANYFEEQGIVYNQDFTRYTLRLNIDHQINDRIRIGTSTLGVFSLLNGEGFNPYGGALQENPLGKPFDDNGRLIFLPTTDGLRTNPAAEVVPGANIDETKRNRIFSSIYGEIKLFDGLSYRLNFGPDLQNFRYGRFQGSQTNARRGGDPTAFNLNGSVFNYTLENIINYTKTFSTVHNLNLTLLHSIQKDRFERYTTDVRGVPAETQEFYNLGAATIIQGVSSTLVEWGLQSFMGRANYSFNNKYLLTLTGRVDGSSRLAEGNKYGFFPSVAVGWNLSEEAFIKNSNLIDNLKLRASYGATGNSAVQPYQTQALLARTVYAFGSSGAYGYRPNVIGNPNLQWETSTTLNIGVDFGFFKNRISGSVEFYQTNTSDLLLRRQLPITSGYSSVLENIGETRNTGFEATLSTANIDSDNGFRWTTDLNFFTNTEEIVSLYGGNQNDVGNNWFIGEPITVYYDFEKIGIWQSNEVDEATKYQRKVGEIKVRDQNGDGKIDAADRIILGSDIPDWSGGMTNTFEFKGVDLSIFIFARQGNMIRSRFHDDYNTLFGRYNNIDVDYWTPNNPTNAYPRPNQNQEFPVYSSTLSYFDGSFIKVRNVTLGYTFPSSLTDRIKLQSMRLYLSAQNPLIFSSYVSEHKGIDPERARTPDGNNQERNAEVGADTPSTRLFLLGLNVKF